MIDRRLRELDREPTCISRTCILPITNVLSCSFYNSKYLISVFDLLHQLQSQFLSEFKIIIFIT